MKPEDIVAIPIMVWFFTYLGVRLFSDLDERDAGYLSGLVVIVCLSVQHTVFLFRT